MVRYKHSFYRVIESHYPKNFTDLIRNINVTFLQIYPSIQFAKTSTNPMDRRMEVAGYFLATIQTLDKAGESYGKIRKVLLEIANDYVQPKNAWQRFSKKIPVLFVGKPFMRFILRKFGKQVSKKDHPDGFVANLITSKEETLGFGYGVDILECGICKLFKRYQYERFTPLLCEVDHITSSLAGLTLKRTGTIALGAQKCDFRFERKA